MDELGDTNDVAAFLKVSRPRVHQLADEDPTFPQAVRSFGRMRVWHMPAVRAWAERDDIKARRTTPGRPRTRKTPEVADHTPKRKRPES